MEVDAAALAAAVSRDRWKTQIVLDTRGLAQATPYLVREMLIATWREQDWPLQAMGFAEWEALSSLAMEPPAEHSPGGEESTPGGKDTSIGGTDNSFVSAAQQPTVVPAKQPTVTKKTETERLFRPGKKPSEPPSQLSTTRSLKRTFPGNVVAERTEDRLILKRRALSDERGT